MAMLRPVVVEVVAEGVELVAEVDGLALVGVVLAAGVGDPPEHPANATAVAATIAAVVRRRIPLSSLPLIDESCLA
jgi:predicted signal transduction protein with EAL and GGDEF domain